MYLFFVYLALVSLPIEAKTLDLNKGTRSLYIQEKVDWRLGKEVFGMPFIYFSPPSNGQRSNISFTDTGANIELEFRLLKKSKQDYQDNKKKWSSKVGATLTSYIPYKKFKNLHGHKVHQIGVNYKHQNKHYIENSFYIECRGRIVFSKSLRLKKNKIHEDDFKDLINSIDCGGV